MSTQSRREFRHAMADFSSLLAGLQPVLDPRRFVFSTLGEGQSIPVHDIIASVREVEGLSVIVERAVADRHGLVAPSEWAWITLGANSDLTAVGLTAAVSSALANAEISCNVVAGHHHDHLFVPYALRETAMEILRSE